MLSTPALRPPGDTLTATDVQPLQQPAAANPCPAPWRRHADAIVRAYLTGWTISRIEAEYGIWDSDLYRLLTELGIPSRRATKRAGYPPLPPASEIARQYQGGPNQPGTTATELASLYGVSRTTITNRLRQADTATRSARQTALLYHRADWEHLLPEILAAARTGQAAARICATFPISRRQLRGLRTEHGLT